jgi:hypothetical protein
VVIAGNGARSRHVTLCCCSDQATVSFLRWRLGWCAHACLPSHSSARSSASDSSYSIHPSIHPSQLRSFV